MPRRRGLEAQPRDYLQPGQQWPGGALIEGAPAVAHFAKQVAERLASKLGEDHTPTRYAVAKEADISRQTLANVLDGRTWADLPTIYRLEVALKHQLWRNDDYPHRTSGHSTADNGA